MDGAYSDSLPSSVPNPSLSRVSPLHHFISVFSLSTAPNEPGILHAASLRLGMLLTKIISPQCPQYLVAYLEETR